MQIEKLIGLFTGGILFFLSALHVYWAFGGKLTSVAVIPETNGKPTFVPGRGLTLLVALVLFAFGAVALWVSGNIFSPNRTSAIFSLLISLIFIGRAIGDFRLVGYFKKIKNTKFAKYDYLLYSPVCILLGASYLYLGWRSF
ncbi:DUF3995 domain-containing protein [Leptospira sp. WS58.C1]|uniref:DUF3995 domain-containing protein n=1 Tax=Leptospira TaxID=171 RepID=UPI0002BF6CC4|nr:MULTISPECIES: DUF3995 domain-containing protein [unclassified Leptospira]EMJ97904.1 PF13160 family protein [Leptospira sp. B5-022]MCR1794631.1 DUF3995 domain-containing protein [Leptospira sp. id769339]